jgi:heme exporter protein C
VTLAARPFPASAPGPRRGTLFRYASPATFYPLAGRLQAPFALLALALAAAGLAIGFLVAPTDAQQGEGYRIIFVHVPASWMAMFLYCVMAFWAAVGLAFNIRLASMMASALAPTGAMFALLSLVTGSLWGKPMWGTWWVWDARLTSTLILLFLYLGFIALQSAIDDPRRADKAGAILALVGVVNVPVIYFSVKWWNTLHQGASVSLTRAPSMAQTMLWAMLLMALAFWMYAVAVALARVRNLLLEREAQTEWVQHAVAQRE